MTDNQQLSKFLDRVIPWSCDEERQTFVGIHWTVISQNGKTYWTGRAARTVDEAIKEINRAQSMPNTRDIYVAMGSQKECEEATTKNGYKYLKPIRNQQNVAALKTLFLDIDVKDEDKGYLDQKRAAIALTKFCEDVDLPRPTLVVSSGGGLHCHWALDRPLSSDEWKPLANALAEATRQHNLKCDTQVTVDSARILRPPETLNFKSNPPRATRIVGKIIEEDYSAERIKKALEPYLKASPSSKGNEPIITGQVSSKLIGIKNEAAAGITTGVSVSLNAVSKECSFIKEALDTAGERFGQPLWNLTTLIATFTEDPALEAHRMSRGHSDYESATTDALLKRKIREQAEKEIGWPSCKAILDAGFEKCRECSHLKKLKSLLNFGYGYPHKSEAMTDLLEISLEDFYAFMPTHSYIHKPTRSMWVAVSVNARLPRVPKLDQNNQPVLDERGKPIEITASLWLDQNRPVEQMTWAPGQPEVIADRVMNEGGWRDHKGSNCFNMYLPPTNLDGGEASLAEIWINLVRKIYPNEADHIINWLAHRVQRPEEKINHALVLGGLQGIGKDTILVPLKFAVGHWNFAETNPLEMLDKFNPYAKSVVLRINEARDLGEMNRFQFYDRTKTIITAPPDTITINEKHLRQYSVLNVCGVIITTNYKTDGIFLPPDDRRHFVCWTEVKKDDSHTRYLGDIYRWYNDGGNRHVAAFLKAHDLSNFDPKAPPPKTRAFWEIADANRTSEEIELADAILKMGEPEAFTIDQLRDAIPPTGVKNDIGEWLRDGKNKRTIPHRLEKCGYTAIRSETVKDGRWKIAEEWKTIYAKTTLTIQSRLGAARLLTERLNRAAQEKEEKERQKKERARSASKFSREKHRIGSGFGGSR